ncbi:glycoside hydrolase family 7 protein [Podospora didyma]|uniref:Glucanase n=1 Tax=Podospora didyma TaxID=330526 RepID=A0AAE0K009_9PEZI|nr:glycoside hydrolase family 7 protein [Podospora didyma]
MASTLSYIKLAAWLFAGTGLAQSLASDPEAHPLLPTWKCTKSGGCVQQNTSVVLDFEYRNVHTIGGSTSCKTGNKLNQAQCPNAETCAKNCVVEPADYAAMGVSTSGNAVTMYHYVKTNGKLNSASPRIYLLDANGKYVMMNLLNAELSVDVDLSTLPCGENGAFYLSEMTADGSKNPGQFNVGGAGAGNGYCDAQCQGYCCNEMDILEANSMANAFTGHPCKGNNCDKGGCGYNPYASGQKNFWGPGKTVDTSKPFTVITQFPASGGRLSQITRKYVQNGRTINSGAISNCGSEGSTGGLTGMGQALGRGMVLAMSIWNDAAQNMAWLDSGVNGPCTSGQGSPSNIQSQHPDTHVVFSNIRWGEIGSTGKA